MGKTTLSEPTLEDPHAELYSASTLKRSYEIPFHTEISIINMTFFWPGLKSGCISMRPERSQPSGQCSMVQLLSQG